ncbi:hypothetical protein MLD38_021217 [Melastoma candidum]|uniref:Uncharacterized protein n=1 Tax=Melastoma candidum TaxID=119954 RepID=A0ACB9QFY3_9MYRT|nr:hypothetical protein MLD38_021217 [Melastoma candidum]
MIQTPTNTIYSYRPCNKDGINDHPRTRGMSFLALVFFVFFYICIFYVFNISPRDAMNDGRFLFFLSNTLVMILAADFGTFTSSLSSKVVNAYESNGKVSVPCNELAKLPVATYAEAEGMKELIVVGADPRDEEEHAADAPQVSAGTESVKLLTYHDAISYDGWGDVGVKDDEERSEETVEDGEQVVEKGEEEEDNEETSQMSDKELNERVVKEDNDEFSQMSEELNERAGEEDDDEFSQMSDEELNKRVEEFIWRLKTQIRLQAARDTDFD